MIYLSTIMSSDIWDLKALYEGANVQRLVASVTIMESLPIREWAKGGELLLTSSRTLPENEQDLLELLHDMQRLSTAALAVKCRETDEHMARVKRLSILAQEWQIPIFLIPPQRTYLSLFSFKLIENLRMLSFLSRSAIRFFCMSVRYMSV